ncbi:hypothetical protein PHMEG_00013902 [Phytophthora megakarya]|uniref:Retrotransposon gag domain-containing protein n=1 Tax=Phytophthora megakarya TaxID=4795 RepID=A0A225W583_9STRA|nr:hypothetical protein PHMEG_00013902 [Phytophthora megakarya]
MRQTQEALARFRAELAQKRQADEAILAAHAEAAIQAERFRAAKETEDRLKTQQFQTEADFAERLRIQRMQDESERARWMGDVQKSTNMQIAILQQQMREMEAERDREREAAKNIQKFQASQLRDLRATSAQVQHATVTSVPDAQDAKGQDAGSVAVKKEKSSDRDGAAVRADALLAAQLQATIQSVNAAKQRTKPATTVSTAVKAEAGASATKAPAPKSSDDAKAKAKEAAPKTRTSRKVRRGGYPSDSDPSSEDDDSDPSSDDADRAFCEPLRDMVVPKATQGDTTTMTIRPFVTASSLDDFDEKASLSERTRWWERFQTLSFQGGWSDKMKVYELRLKLSSSARNWRSQLSPHVRCGWTRFSKQFKVKYCKSKMSDSERYYTMKQRKAETPLDFLYRLNVAADRADIRYKKSERRREQHVKRFTHRLADSQLKNILKSQRFKSMDDAEAAGR